MEPHQIPLGSGRDAEWEAASVLAAVLGVGLLVTFIEPAVLLLGLPLARILRRRRDGPTN